MPEDHGGCRAREFIRWDRVMLQHEREHLSRSMAAPGLLSAALRDGIMHDLADIDYLLAQLPPASVPGQID